MRRNIGWKLTTLVLIVCLVAIAGIYHRLLFPKPDVIVPGLGPLNPDGTVKYPRIAERRGNFGAAPGAPAGRGDRGARRGGTAP